MSRNARKHVSTGPVDTSDLSPKHLTKQEFGRRVFNLMMKKQWTQSDLARAAGLNRDAISTYVRGRSLPEPKNLKALAAALGTTPEQLLPNYFESALDEDTPALELRISPGAPDTAWLRVNQMVSSAVALKIIEALENDDVAHGKRSRADSEGVDLDD